MRCALTGLCKPATKSFVIPKVPMNKPCNIQNTNICNGIFHISFVKALLINEGETTWGERESCRTGIGRVVQPGTVFHFEVTIAYSAISMRCALTGLCKPATKSFVIFVKALLINEGETTWGERESCRTGIGRSEATRRGNGIRSETTRYHNTRK
jgi:hypothetical protein